MSEPLRRRSRSGFASLTLALFAAASIVAAPSPVVAQEATPPFDWRKDWNLGPGFAIELDSDGFFYPTGIAFVPQPGSRPDDPLYFVTELRDRVKVVTNDRSVHVFAEGFQESEFHDETPDGGAEFGVGGVCLDPVNGYVFVTYAYQDERKLLRNNIVRFKTEPGRFSVRPESKIELTALFFPYKSGVSHQIGPCQVRDGLLYVSVGDGFDTPHGSQQLDTLLGKVLRMTLDGKPAPGNPFDEGMGDGGPASYVWAYGLRNPFGLKTVGDRLFAADNGLNTDRFVEIDEGRNYLWDGTERSIGINASAVISPSVGPVQMDFLPPDAPIFAAEHRGSFYVALSGRVPGIMIFDYDFAGRRMRRAPTYFMQARGRYRQMITGLAFGPDGLYFSPLFRDPEGRGPILKIVEARDGDAAGTLLENPNPWVLLYEKGCYGCHKLGDLIRGGNLGPPLDREGLIPRLQAQLDDPAYLATLDEIDALDEEPQRSFRRARQEIRESRGLDRIRVWMVNRIHEPRFDRVSTKMPNLNVSTAEAKRLTDFLLGTGAPPKPRSWRERVIDLFPKVLRRSHLVLFGLGGFVGGGVVFWLAQLVWRRVISRRAGR